MRHIMRMLTYSLLSAVVVGTASAVCAFMWTVIATVIGTQDTSLLFLPAFFSGCLAGVFIHVLPPQGYMRALISTVIMIAGWLVFSRFMPFGLPLSNVWAISGTLISFGATGLLLPMLPHTDQRGATQNSLALIWILKIVGYSFFIFIVFFPFYFMLTASTKPRAELLNNPLDLRIKISQGLETLLVGYTEIMQRFNFGRYILNSVIISLTTIVLTLIPAVSGAYAVTRLRFPGREFFSKAILLVYMFPAILVAIPLYSITSQLGIRNSLLSLIIVYPAMTIPVALYMLRSYFFTLPKDIEEAARIDGCNRLQVIFRVTLPLSIPAIASVALYVFMIAWNEFLFSFMLIDSPDFFTLSRGVASLNTQETPRQFLMSGAVIITLPVIIIMFWLERLLAGGLTLGGVKE